MNSSNVLRIINRTGKICFNNDVWSKSRSIKTLNICRMSTNVSAAHTKKERDRFLDVLPIITETLTSNPKFNEVPEIGPWLKKVLEYNLSGGKKARGLTTVIAYEMLEKPELVTEESLQQARIMGWCVEMLQAYLLVLDDMMDGSVTRRGLPCWYRLPEVGFGAINDSILIHMAIFQTLKTNFSHQPYYTDVLELFNDTLLNTSIGQHLDYTMAHRNKNDYSLFTIERYNAIVKYKTAFYTYKLPLSLGLYLAGRPDRRLHAAAEDIAVDIGQFFQIQDDYIDCFGDEAVSGKRGTDIQEGKCSWLAVRALERCDAAARAEFAANYARAQPERVRRVRALYERLRLPALYRDTERAAYRAIQARAQALAAADGDAVSPALVLRLLDMIYNRKQ